MVLSLQVPVSNSCALTVCLMHHDHLIGIGYHEIKGKKNCVFSLISKNDYRNYIYTSVYKCESKITT